MLRKVMFAARSRSDLGRAAALRHLLERHAPLVAGSGTLRRRLKTYIQNHAFEPPGVTDITREYDWIIESWRDTSATLPEPPVEPDAIRVREDEARFPDRTSLLVLNIDPVRVWTQDPAAPFATAPFKLFTYFRRPAGVQADTFEAGWIEQAQRLAESPAFRRHAHGFIRNRPLPGDAPHPDRLATPTAPTVPAYDAVDEWRFRSADDISALFAEPAFVQTLDAYRNQLMAPAGFFRLAAREHVIFDDACVDPGGRGET